MKQVTFLELQRDCDQLLEDVRAGEHIHIVDGEELVAQLVPATRELISEIKENEKRKRSKSPRRDSE